MAKKKTKKEEIKTEEVKTEEVKTEEVKNEEIKSEENIDQPKEEVKNEEKEEPKLEKKEKKKKNKVVIILIVVIVLLLLVIGGLLIHQFWPKNNNDDTEKVAEVSEGMLPPKDANILDYNEMNNGGGGGLSLQCYIEDSLEAADKMVLNPGDTFNCMYGVEVINGFKINALYFEFDYGDGLEYLGTTSVYDGYLKTEENRSKLLVKKASSVVDSGYSYQFRVKDNATNENMYVTIKDIVFRTSTKKYYSIKDATINLIRKSNKFYIYLDEEYGDLDVYDFKKDFDNKELVGEYKCSSDDCYSQSNSSGDYVLLWDSGHIAYNYKKDEIVDLSKFNNDDIEITARSELIGIIVFKQVSDDDGMYGYYLYKEKKYALPFNDNIDFIIQEGNYLSVLYQDDEVDFLDFNGKDYVPTPDDMERIGETDFYYMSASYGIESYRIYLYNKDGKKLFNGKKVEGSLGESSNGNLLLQKGNKFVEYDINENVIYESQKYNAVDINGEYIVVVDTDSNLRIIDDRENEIHNFGKLPDDAYIHWPLSGYYDYDGNGKEGIYIVVQTNEVTKEELKASEDFENDEDFDSWYEEEDKGYEYYYIPETGESGKFATFIGGYAKPILYLYPTQDNTKVTVTFEKPNLLTTTYPKYKYEWKVTADRNGDLHDMNGKYYYGLYWEEEGSTNVDFTEGFYVTKDNAIEFLEEKLTVIGLNDRERNEFIMYWLPILEKNGQNLVYFELTEERDNFNKLNINPLPDSLLRVAIHVKKVNKKTNIKEQKLPTFERKGFTAVEWGGVVH